MTSDRFSSAIRVDLLEDAELFITPGNNLTTGTEAARSPHNGVPRAMGEVTLLEIVKANFSVVPQKQFDLLFIPQRLAVFSYELQLCSHGIQTAKRPVRQMTPLKLLRTERAIVPFHESDFAYRPRLRRRLFVFSHSPCVLRDRP